MTGEEIIRLRDSLAAKRAPLESHWDELSAYFMPFRLSDTDLPDIPTAKDLFDSTGRNAATIFANGLASLIIPREEVWFEFAPPAALKTDDEAIRWYRQASVTLREYFEASPFYEEAQESLIESPVYGTAAIYIGDVRDDEDAIHFRHLPIKTYLIAEDSMGRVNLVVRQLQLTATQARDEFGQENLPSRILDCLSKPDAAASQKFDFTQAVYPRTNIPDKDAPAADRSPYVGTTIFDETKEIVGTNSFHEFPFAVHRYRRFGRTAYGFGPGSYALGDARQLEKLQELADIATEKQVFPPILAPNSLEGEIDHSALGVTYYDPNDPNGFNIRELVTNARYDIALDRIERKQNSLEKAFHVDLFQLFSSRAKERAPMTATEASLVAGEKLTQFSPTFGRLVSEFLTPILFRSFAILFRAGKLGTPPPSVLTERGLAAPAVSYKNAIMLAMQERENASYMKFFEITAPAAQIDPSVYDSIIMPVAARRVARNVGIPEEAIRSIKEIEARTQAREQAAAAQQAAALAEQAASAAGKLGSAPAPIQQALTS